MSRTRTKRGTAGGPLERQSRATSGRGVVDGAVERSCARAVAAAAEATIACLENGGTGFCGNGGSAADAQHLACELPAATSSTVPRWPRRSHPPTRRR